MNELQKMVIKVLGILSMEYPNFKFDESREKVWRSFLGDISPGTIYAAVIRIMSSERQFAPTVGEVRNMALRISAGLSQEHSEIDAWENILKKMHDEKHQLSELEKKALAKIGKIWDIKHCKDIGFERAAFYKAFRHVAAKEVEDRNTPPMVKNLIAANAETAPQLPPAKVERQHAPGEVYGARQYSPPPQSITEPETESNGWEGYTDEERSAAIRGQCAGLAGKMGDL